MGLHAEIYRGDYRCELNRFDKVNQVTIINVDGPFDPSDDAPAAVLEKGPGGFNPVIRPIVPAGTWTMYGGTLAHTCDSRLGEAVRNLYRSDMGPVVHVLAISALPIHYRIK